jgi:hypothetical protein
MPALVTNFSIVFLIIMVTIFVKVTSSPIGSMILFSWLDRPSGPRPPHLWGFKITLRHTTLGITPLGK